jgi:O-antigen/teichoic acid export membrane protein
MRGNSNTLVELKSLGKQSFYYLASLLGNVGLGFISFPIFTRAFSVSDYGLIDFTQKLLLLPTAASKIGLQNAALRFYDGKDSAPKNRAGYYSTMMLGVAGAGTVMTVLVASAARLLVRSVLDRPLASLLYLAAILILVRAVQSVIWSFLRVEERTETFCIAGVTMKAATIGAVCVLIAYQGASAHTYISGTLLAEGAVLAVFTIPLVRRGLVRIRYVDPRLLRAAVRFGLPLIVYELAGVALMYGDRGMVRYWLGEQALGYYTAAYGLSCYVNDFVTGPLGMAITPMYLRIWAQDGRTETSKFLTLALDGFLMVATLVFVGTSLICEDALVLLASSKYSVAGPLIPVLVGAMLIYTTHQFLCAGLLIEKRTGTMACVFLGAAALNLGINVVLLPLLGIKGAAIAALATRGLCVAVLWRISMRILPLSIKPAGIARYAACGLAALLIGMQIDLHSILLKILVRAAVAVLVYVAGLCLLDSRARTLLKGFAQGRCMSEAVSAALLG